ncbi:protein SpAN-like isoform X2 [Scylla paramamosain]|uniref:protein SpAN-like isoform X2 n=1 Tax=Scylla paramamosain TaxID=85552 RepID=UPI0030827218
MACCTWRVAITFFLATLVASHMIDEGGRQMGPVDGKDFLVPDFIDTNPSVINGQPVFEGDIILTENQWAAVRARKGLSDLTKRWSEGSDGYPVVPYRFTDDRLNKNVIKAGMEHWMDHTCIKFQETTNTNQPHLMFLYESGCWSWMGMLSQNGQNVSIGENCDSLGTVAHEVGHAIGFNHEQCRPDRDEYVVINWDNIPSPRQYNFAKASASEFDNQNVPYDYSSNMQYGSTGFTSNGKTTIATVDPLTQGLIGTGEVLSHRDKHLANIMYKCIDKWLAKCGQSSDTCKNGGYFGVNCACVCPPGTAGTECEQKTGGYYDSLLNSCTEKVTTQGTLTSPNYPSNYPKGQCVKWIVAPECHVPKVTFTDFTLCERHSYCNNNECCYFDALEIRTTSMTNGDVYCDTDIVNGQSFTGTSREMILYFRAKSYYYRKGWSANVTFVKQDGCK